MTSPSARTQGPSRVELLLVVVALAAGSLAAGILIFGLGRGGSDPAAAGAATTAPGLRASALPGDLDRTPAPDFRLRDGRGGTVDTRALRGHPYAVTFLYTQCIDVCPTIAEDLKRALARAPGAFAVAVSVDPDGDTPSAVRAFARTHRLPPSFRYAIGDRRELQRLWRSYFVAAQTGDPRTSNHTATTWLVDARGRLRGMYPGGAALDDADVAHDLRALS